MTFCHVLLKIFENDSLRNGNCVVKKTNGKQNQLPPPKKPNSQTRPQTNPKTLKRSSIPLPGDTAPESSKLEGGPLFQGTRHVPPPAVFLRGQVCLVCDLTKGLGLCKGTDCHVCTQSNFKLISRNSSDSYLRLLSPSTEAWSASAPFLDAKKNWMFCHKIKATTASILVLCFESMQIPTVLIYWMLVRSAAQDLY